MSDVIAVTGATGFVGSNLIRRLAASEYKVKALCRSLPLQKLYCPLVEWVKISQLGDVAEATAALRGAKIVVHLAARAHVLHETASDPRVEFLRVNRDITVKLAEAAVRAGVRRFVYVSSIGVNGDVTRGMPFTENSPPNPKTGYALSKWEAERSLQGYANRIGLETVVIRPPLVYGAHAPGNFQSLLRSAALRLPLPFGSCTNRRSIISVSNLVAFLIVCIEHPQASNQIFVVSDGMAVSTKQIVSSLRRGMKRRRAVFPVSPFIMRTALALAGKSDTYQQLFGNLEVDSGKAEQLLGWAPDRNTLKQLEAVGASYVNSHP